MAASLLLLQLALGCTPLKVNGEERNDERSAPLDDAGAAGDAATSARARGVDVDAPCPDESARSCARTERATPLACEGGSWIRQAACDDHELCETAEGPDQGTCIAIAPECLSHDAGVEFCDGDFIRRCDDQRLTERRSCGALRRCMESADDVQCICAQGAVDAGNGAGCPIAADCSVDNGGCDPNTVCSVEAGEPHCTDCPPGYAGTGLAGCLPELSTLELSDGALELTPQFSPGVHDYQVALTLLQQRLKLTAAGPAGTTIEVDGAKLSDGMHWESPPLPYGEQKIMLRVVAKSGRSGDYALTVKRSGAQEAYVKASNPEAGDAFGYGIALYGDTLVVGAAYEDGASGGINGDESSNSAADSGAAYVFVRTGDEWVQQAYLKPESPVDDDYFGVQVAIWEDTIAVGAMGADPFGSTTAHGGSVYVYVREAGKWSQQARLVPDGNGVQALLGLGLTLHADELVAGAPLEGSGALASGAVYVYRREAGKWGDPVKLKADPVTANSLFGWSAALDGDTLLIGATEYVGASAARPGPGSAYVFTRDGAGWVQVQHLQSPNPVESATFGWSVGLVGDTAAIGAPRATEVQSSESTSPSGEVYSFERTAGRWSFSQVLKAPIPRRVDYFGSALALTDTALLVGASGDASTARSVNGELNSDGALASGAAYLYERKDSQWALTASIKAANAETDDMLGDRLAMSGDSVALAAVGEDGASPGVDGDQADNSAAISGAVYVFR